MTGDKVNPPAGEIRLNGRLGFSASEGFGKLKRNATRNAIKNCCRIVMKVR
jgi:hypothetical protein